MRYIRFTIISTIVVFSAALFFLQAEEGITNKTAAELFPRDQFIKMLGAKPDVKAFMPDNPAFSIEEANALKYPSSWNWKDQNIMTPVRSQGSCGSCWAFSSVAIFEALIKQKSLASVDLAEQQLVNCVSDSHCSGGYASSALAYMKTNGIVYEVYYPYTATDGICNVTRASDYYLTNWWSQYLASSSLASRINAVKKAIYDYGPSVLWMMIYNDFYYSYSSGVYIYDGHSAEAGAHLIAVTGWVDDSSITNGGYWICKNSWGASWGESGYFRIGYGQAGIDDYLYYARWVGQSNYPPVFDATLGPQSGREGTAINISFTATDPEDDPITYSASPLPAGATVNSTAGTFTWTPTYTQAGTYTISFIASDGKAQSVQTITITITNVKYINK